MLNRTNIHFVFILNNFSSFKKLYTYNGSLGFSVVLSDTLRNTHKKSAELFSVFLLRGVWRNPTEEYNQKSTLKREHFNYYSFLSFSRQTLEIAE